MNYKKRNFSIEGRDIGVDFNPYCIAEVGINHNGSLETAKEMILQAKKSGADAVKFQTLKSEEFCGDPEHLLVEYSFFYSYIKLLLPLF